MKMIMMEKFNIATINHNFGIIDEWLNLLNPTMKRLRTKNGKLLKTADGKYLKVRN